MESRGYQLIEPAALAGLVAAPSRVEFAIAILHWVIDRLRADIGKELAHVELEVIRAEYHGAYPAIGARYLRDGSDVASVVEAAVEGLLSRATAGELVRYLVSSPKHWGALTADTMKGAG